MLPVFDFGLTIHVASLYRLLMIRLDFFISFIAVKLIFDYAFVVGM